MKGGAKWSGTWWMMWLLRLSGAFVSMLGWSSSKAEILRGHTVNRDAGGTARSSSWKETGGLAERSFPVTFPTKCRQRALFAVESAGVRNQSRKSNPVNFRFGLLIGSRNEVRPACFPSTTRLLCSALSRPTEVRILFLVFCHR